MVRRTRLIERREAVGLSQEALAQLIDVDRSTVVRWERGERKPQPWHRRKLAAALELTMEQLDELLAEGQGPTQAIEFGGTGSMSVIAGHVAPNARLARHQQQRQALGSGDVMALPDALLEFLQSGADSTGSEIDLIELATVLDQRGASAGQLGSAEIACSYLDQNYARLGADQVLPPVRALLAATVADLRQPQSVSYRRRLCALAARLAGLRAWLCFDLDQHRQAERWYGLAVGAAQEAEDWSLAAWLVGASSLLPTLRGDHRRAVHLAEQGLYLANYGADPTTTAWLFALLARGRAGQGDRHGFEAAGGQAARAAERSLPDDRRHGMDFHQGRLDLRYYLGCSRLLLHQPEQAMSLLRGSREDLPASHTKAQAVLGLLMADAAARSCKIDEAVELTRDALTSTRHQAILPILHQAKRVQTLIYDSDPVRAKGLTADLEAFAGALNASVLRPSA